MSTSLPSSHLKVPIDLHVWASAIDFQFPGSKLYDQKSKLIKKHCISYCDTIKKRTGVNAMWVINKSLDVIDVIGKPSFLGSNISTWEFSTLCTSIPHDKLKIRISYELLERVFTTVQCVTIAFSGLMIILRIKDIILLVQNLVML